MLTNGIYWVRYKDVFLWDYRQDGQRFNRLEKDSSDLLWTHPSVQGLSKLVRGLKVGRRFDRDWGAPPKKNFFLLTTFSHEWQFEVGLRTRMQCTLDVTDIRFYGPLSIKEFFPWPHLVTACIISLWKSLNMDFRYNGHFSSLPWTMLENVL